MTSVGAARQLAGLQNSQAYTTPFLVHKNNMWSEIETPEAEAFGLICFDLFIYILSACVGMCVATTEKEM